ncbi:Beta-Casp domain protein [compost metagenome]
MVVAGNGTCSSGRIVDWLKAMLSEQRHNVLFVGYLRPGRANQVHGPEGGYGSLDGERHEVRVGIAGVGGYPAHVDQKELLVGFITRMREWPSEVQIVHGKEHARYVWGLLRKRHLDKNLSVGMVI